MSQFLCVLPWNHVFTSNDGHYFTCCLSQNESRLEYNKKNLHTSEPRSIQDLKKSENLINLKTDMLIGKVPKNCLFCKKIEDSGKSSYRNYVNGVFKNTYDKIMETKRLEPVETEFIDIRFSNKCNLKCRMCHLVRS